jgi:hypothetical protein
MTFRRSLWNPVILGFVSAATVTLTRWLRIGQNGRLTAVVVGMCVFVADTGLANIRPWLYKWRADRQMERPVRQLGEKGSTGQPAGLGTDRDRPSFELRSVIPIGIVARVPRPNPAGGTEELTVMVLSLESYSSGFLVNSRVIAGGDNRHVAGKSGFGVDLNTTLRLEMGLTDDFGHHYLLHQQESAGSRFVMRISHFSHEPLRAKSRALHIDRMELALVSRESGDSVEVVTFETKTMLPFPVQ